MQTKQLQEDVRPDGSKTKTSKMQLPDVRNEVAARQHLPFSSGGHQQRRSIRRTDSRVAETVSMSRTRFGQRQFWRAFATFGRGCSRTRFGMASVLDERIILQCSVYHVHTHHNATPGQMICTLHVIIYGIAANSARTCTVQDIREKQANKKARLMFPKN